MDVRARLRQQYGFDETLPSGLTVTLKLPRIRDCIQAGRIPLPVLNHVMQQARKAEDGQVPDVPDEELDDMARFQDEIVRQSVLAIDGELVELSLEDVRLLSEPDYDHIVALALRRKPSPKAPTTPEPSLPSQPQSQGEPSPEWKPTMDAIPQPVSNP